MNNKIKDILIYLIVIISGIFIGVLIDRNFLIKIDPENLSDAYENGWQAAHNRLYQAGTFQALGDDIEIFSVSGVLEENNTDSLKVKIIPIEPMAKPEFDVRIINIDANTKIYKTASKDEKKYLEELNKLKGEDQNSFDPNTADGLPSQFFLEEISSDNIKIGTQMVIDSLENIRNSKNFTASKITIY